MIATTEEALDDLFKDAIVGITPRLTYEGAEAWKPYDRAVKGPSVTRRFLLKWDRPVLRGSGAMAGNIFEFEARLRVRTDYAGDAAQTQFIIIDDNLQLQEVLSGLKSTSNGLQLVAPYNPDVPYTERPGFDEDADVTQVDHTFRVRYMRSIRP